MVEKWGRPHGFRPSAGVWEMGHLVGFYLLEERGGCVTRCGALEACRSPVSCPVPPRSVVWGPFVWFKIFGVFCCSFWLYLVKSRNHEIALRLGTICGRRGQTDHDFCIRHLRFFDNIPVTTIFNQLLRFLHQFSTIFSLYSVSLHSENSKTTLENLEVSNYDFVLIPQTRE